MMEDQRNEIAKKYLLPERPFLHGMASAFDLFGILNMGKRERLMANLQEEFRQRSERDIMRDAWQDVGEALYKAVKRYEGASEGSTPK